MRRPKRGEQSHPPIGIGNRHMSSHSATTSDRPVVVRVLMPGPTATDILARITRAAQNPGELVRRAPAEHHFWPTPTLSHRELCATIDHLLDRPDNPDNRVVRRMTMDL